MLIVDRWMLIEEYVCWLMAKDGMLIEDAR